MDLRQQVIERILTLNEEDLQKVIDFIKQHREDQTGGQAQQRPRRNP